MNISYACVVKHGGISYGKRHQTLDDAKSFFFDEFTEGGYCTIYKVTDGVYKLIAGYSN